MAFERRHARAEPEASVSSPPSLLEEPIDASAPMTGEGGGDPRALLPWVGDEGASPHVLPISPVVAFASPMQMRPHPPPAVPLANPDDLDGRAKRMEAERLLTSKRLEAGEDASKGVDVLLELSPEQRAKAIDHLDDKALENMLDRVPAGEYEKIEGLVDASQDPKRKLRMWKRVHKTRASNDLDRYGSDFGGDDQTDAQRERERRHDRREQGVESDAGEVDREVDTLMAKKDLTVADVDAMRARKDRELAVEMKYDVNLTAQLGPRENGTAVHWSTEDLGHVDDALSQLPSEQLNDPKMTANLRRIGGNILTPRGEYHPGGDALDISDGATSDLGEPAHYGPRSGTSSEFRKTHGDHSAPMEEVLTHEIGHNIADENKAAFDKFTKVSHWRENLTEADIRKDGATDQVVADVEAARRGSSKDVVARTPEKVFSPNNSPTPGTYSEMDATAVPNTPAMAYGPTNGRELFAEVYAQAVLTPETLYSDFVAAPTQAATEASAEVARQREVVEQLRRRGGTGAQVAEAEARLASDEAEARTKARARQQQGEEFSIMRNDVFHGDRAQAQAEARLRAAHATPAQIAAFKARAEHASTPHQIEQLEREIEP